MMNEIELYANTVKTEVGDTGKDTNAREVRVVLFPILGKQSQNRIGLTH
jgi:hypothetical protein